MTLMSLFNLQPSAWVEIHYPGHLWSTMVLLWWGNTFLAFKQGWNNLTNHHKCILHLFLRFAPKFEIWRIFNDFGIIKYQINSIIKKLTFKTNDILYPHANEFCQTIQPDQYGL